jgi:hypothetical protein
MYMYIIDIFQIQVGKCNMSLLEWLKTFGKFFFIELICSIDSFFFWCKSNLLILTYWENIKKKLKKIDKKRSWVGKKNIIMIYFDKNYILSKGWIIVYYIKVAYKFN